MRLLELVFYLLKCHSKVTIKELAETFDVSTKTIQRDIDKLCVLGIPIISTRGKNGGIEIDQNYIIAKQVLKQSDYESLITSLYIGQQFSQNISHSFLIDKYQLMEPKRCSQILNHLNHYFVIDLDDNPFDQKGELYQQLDHAIQTNSYIDLEIRQKRLTVIPISYVLKPVGICLYCYHEDYMLIPITQIVKVDVLNKPFNQSMIPYQAQQEKPDISFNN